MMNMLACPHCGEQHARVRFSILTDAFTIFCHRCHRQSTVHRVEAELQMSESISA